MRVKITDNSWMIKSVASTQGRHYLDQDNKITHYPEYNLPVPYVNKPSIMLEIGSGWGRWLIAADKKGYIPIGLDIKMDHIQSVMRTMRDHNKNAYVVMADMENIPFKPGVFDLVWSFSVLQHAHINKVTSCLGHVNRILNKDGFVLVEVPNSKGIRNRGIVESQKPYWNDVNSLCLRYYTLDEYKEMFTKAFGNFRATIHSLVGIGVLPDDLKHVTWKQKPAVAASLLSTAIARVIPGTKNIADSYYIRANRSEPVETPQGVIKFLDAHNRGFDNLNMVHLMQCPFTGGELELTENKKFLISLKANRRFPITDNVPNMLPQHSEQL